MRWPGFRLRSRQGQDVPPLYFSRHEVAIAAPAQPAGAYAAAGVDIEAGAALVEAIKPLARSTDRPGTMGGLGGFGALFDLRAAGYKDPVLVAATDGVGTKLRVAMAAGRHDTIGIDLVAMCVNDLLVQGAEPLFFLDYFASGKLEVGLAASVVAGIAAGCRQAGCALVGGETAEMPGHYAGADYDLAGFAVGAAERGRLLPRTDVVPGDRVLALASSGVHSNGFSLVRRLVEQAGLGYAGPAPFAPERPLGEALLAPTRIYVRPVLPLVRQGRIKALAHITGGGLTDNIPRVLPDGLGVRLDAGSWTLPPVFAWLKRTGALDDGELARTFNCGIGLIAIVAEAEAAGVAAALAEAGERAWEAGTVVAADGARVRIDGTAGRWAGA